MDEKIRELALQLHGSEAWKSFEENCYYPFALCDGTTGCFELMLAGENAWYMLAYVGEEAVQTLLRAQIAENSSEVELIEASHSLDMYMLGCMDGEILAERCLPRRENRELNEEEKARLCEILTAALSAPEAAKLPKKKKYAYPAFEGGSEELTAKLRAAETNGGKWLAHIFLHVAAILPDEGGEPFYPFMLLLMEEKSGLILTSGLTASFEDYGECFLSALAEAVEAHGRPKTVITVSERSRDFFKPLCAALGIGFEKRSSSPVLREALETYLHFFEEKQREEEESELSYEGEEEYEDDPGWDEVNAVLLGLVADEKSLPQLSTELLLNLLEDMEEGELDDSLKGVILNELHRRK